MSGRPQEQGRAGEQPQQPEQRQHDQHEDGKRSGEGANTALQTMIRQRKLAEGPEPADPDAPPA
jgi:hypothetical protein